MHLDQLRTRLRRIRSSILIPIIIIAALPPLYFALLNRVGGAYHFDREASYLSLSRGAVDLIQSAFADVDSDRLVDFHVHVVGLGTHCAGCSIHPDFYSNLHPLKRMRFRVYAGAAGITDFSQADRQYVERLLGLVRGISGHGRYLLMPFDRHYYPDGRINHQHTEFYVPNDYVYDLQRRYPDDFLAAASINPYRPDALAELHRNADRGIRIIKWLPNAMGIDPHDPSLQPFYAAMRQRNLILMTHAGMEQAVESDEFQSLGNPLYLRAPLDAGVRVIVAHCASLGRSADFESPGAPETDNFRLFLRLFHDPRYERLLYGEISAMTQANRLGDSLATSPIAHILNHPEMHPRLINGSDYPLPGINIVIRTRDLESAGMINAEQRELLNEIYRYNPLLFDYVLKRTIHHPENPEARLSPEIFMAPPEWRLPI